MNFGLLISLIIFAMVITSWRYCVFLASTLTETFADLHCPDTSPVPGPSFSQGIDGHRTKAVPSTRLCLYLQFAGPPLAQMFTLKAPRLSQGPSQLQDLDNPRTFTRKFTFSATRFCRSSTHIIHNHSISSVSGLILLQHLHCCRISPVPGLPMLQDF